MNKRVVVSSLFILASIGLLIAIYFSPVWWVSLTAPNYPEEAFPDGVRIHFHMNGVFNGCKKVEKAEIQAKRSGLEDLMDGARKFLTRANDTLTTLQKAVEDNAPSVRRAVENIEKFAQALGDNADGINTFLADVSGAAKSFTSLANRLVELADNVETILGEEEDPLFPEKSLDMAFMVWVFHGLDKPGPLFKNIKPGLKPGAPLVIVDPVDSEIDMEQEFVGAEIDPNRPTIKQRVQKAADEAGYEITRIETFLPKDYIFILYPKTDR